MCHHAAFVGSTCTSRPDHSSECKCLRAKLSGPSPFKKMRNSYQSAPIFDSEPKLPEYLEELYESIPGENMYEKFTECINCNCCERHQIDKPICIYIPCHSKTIKIDQNEYYCKCNCRQASRFFNRLYSKQPKMREPVIVEDEM